MAHRTLFGFLASRYTRAQSELDELRQRGLELVIAACAAETVGGSSRPAGAPADPARGGPLLSEADVTEVSEPPRPEAPEPDQAGADVGETGPLWPLPEEGERGEGGGLPSGDPEASEDATGAEDPQEPRRYPTPRPAPPVSLDPAPEDVRGAWGAPGS